MTEEATPLSSVTTVGTDVVLRENDGQAIDFAAARAYLPELIEAGAVEDLAHVAHIADLAQLHEKRMENKVRADEAGRLKVEAEAGIGIIDLRAYPRVPGGVNTPLRIGNIDSTGSVRYKWRRLGHAALQNLLPKICDRLAESVTEEIATGNVVRDAITLGAGRCSTAPLRRAWQQAVADGIDAAVVQKRRKGRETDIKVLDALSRRPGATSRELSEETGFHRSTVFIALRRLREMKYVEQGDQRPRKGLPHGTPNAGAPTWRPVDGVSPLGFEDLGNPKPTFEDVSRATGIKVGQIRSVLTDRKTTNFEHAQAIARFLGVEDQLRPAPRVAPGPAALRRGNHRRQMQLQRIQRWAARDQAMRERGGDAAKMYALVRRAEQMADGARDMLQDAEARAEIDAAVLALMDAAVRIYHATTLS